MKKLYILFCHRTEIFFYLARHFEWQNDNTESGLPQYQGERRDFWQSVALDELTSRFNCVSQQQKKPAAANSQSVAAIKSSLSKLMTEMSQERDVVWLMGDLNAQAVNSFAQYLDGLPELKNRLVQPVMIIQDQAAIFNQWLKLGWKKYDPSLYNAQLLDKGAYSWYAEFHEALAKHFTDIKTLIVEPGLDAATAQRDITKQLASLFNAHMPQLPENECFFLPCTFAGLDMARAVFDFPFTFRGRKKFDRNAFNRLLCEVENAERYPSANDLIAAESRDLQKKFTGQNEAFAARLGRKNLFATVPGGANSAFLPQEMPVLNRAQCQPFVKAIQPEMRVALLRHFRDRQEELVPEEKILAATLDSFRQLSPISATFAWPKKEPVLSVLTMSYNHKDYILECMESVSNQKVDFPVEHVIVDDCSKDGTQDIIDNYASTHAHVRPIYLDWRSSGGTNIRKLFNACKSEYAAICDGDDYFSEPTKLQKQVDFLRQDKGYAICFHPVLAVYENNAQQPFVYPQQHLMPRGFHKTYYLADLLTGNFIQTNSVVYRWRFRGGLPEWFRSDICPSDWYWHLLHAETGKIGFIPEIMSVYRRHATSYYAKSFQQTSVEHRRDHGLAELKTYKAINDHFKNRYFQRIASLSNGVLADFLHIQFKENDSSLFDEAIKRYPEFGLHFLKELKIVHKKHPRPAASPEQSAREDY